MSPLVFRAHIPQFVEQAPEHMAGEGSRQAVQAEAESY